MSNSTSFWSRSFILLALANLLMAISFYFMLPVLPMYLVEKLGATKSEIGVILAFYTIAALIIRLFAGWFLDTYGRRSIYLIAYILFSLLFIGYPLAYSVLLFILIRFLHGLTWGVLTTSGSTIAVDIIPKERRGEGIGVFGLSMTIGMALGPMLAIFIAGDSQYLKLFIAAILITVFGIILTFFIKFPKFSKSPTASAFSFKSLIEKSSIPISLNMMIIMFTYGGVLSFISLYGKEIGVNNSGLFFLILSIGIGLSRIMSGKIFDKSGPRKVSIVGLVLLVMGFPLLAFVKTSLGFHVGAVILGLGFGIIMPTFQVMINNLVEPNRRGAANSTFFTAFDLGIGAGMIGTGILSQWFGFTITFIVSSIFNLFALIVFILNTNRYYHKNFLKG
jgi:MFS family permease